MIDEALIKITVNTEKDDLQMEVVNPPEFDEDMIDDFVKNHPASAVAYAVIHKIDQGVKADAKNKEKKNNESV